MVIFTLGEKVYKAIWHIATGYGRRGPYWRVLHQPIWRWYGTVYDGPDSYRRVSEISEMDVIAALGIKKVIAALRLQAEMLRKEPWAVMDSIDSLKGDWEARAQQYALAIDEIAARYEGYLDVCPNASVETRRISKRHLQRGIIGTALVQRRTGTEGYILPIGQEIIEIHNRTAPAKLVWCSQCRQFLIASRDVLYDPEYPVNPNWQEYTIFPGEAVLITTSNDTAATIIALKEMLEVRV